MPPAVAAHRRIAADITRRIADGEWRQGDPLPSRAELGRHYRVHEQTIRLAVVLLQDRGVLESQGQRKRVEVAQAPTVRTFAYPDEPWPHGSETNSGRTMAATDDLAARLDLNPGVRLSYEVQECLDPQGRSALIITTWWRGKRRRPHASYTADVDTIPIDHDQAEALRLPVDTVALRIVRTRYDEAGHPVETSDLVLPRDRWRIRLR